MPKKRFGQHFLSDPNVVDRILEFSCVGPDDTVVEIGPGAGALTRELARKARRVIAIEIDADLIAPLRTQMPSNVDIVHADALELDFQTITAGPFRVVSNLPYNVATALFKRFIASRRSIIDVTVMIQKEVAERIVAGPSVAAYGPLSVLIQFYAEPQLGFIVPAGAFRPKPKVESAVIRLQWLPGAPDAREFTDFVHDAFGSRRKKLINNLLQMHPHKTRNELMQCMQDAGVSLSSRPENLSVSDYWRLFGKLRNEDPAGLEYRPPVYNPRE